MKNQWFRKVLAFGIGWLVALVLWRIIRRFGVNVHLEIFNIPVSRLTVLISILCISVITGLIFGSMQYMYEKYFTTSVSFKGFLVRALLVHLVLMLGIYFSVYLVINATGVYQDVPFLEFVSNPLLLVNLFYSILVNSAIILLIQINRLLGKGNLAKLVTGKFHTPREELRVFIFLDLKASTTIAEQLGHIKYSRFIQDCFHDISVVDQYRASIYQYVGDEVVLTWKIHQEDTLEDCIYAFFAYENRLKARADYYQQEYGVQPVFKAGLHLGPVTVVEVGNLKREIAHHGDTINVASRIQEQCNAFDRTLLISEEAFKRLKYLPEYSFENVGEFTLRGRKKSIQLYGVGPPIIEEGPRAK